MDPLREALGKASYVIAMIGDGRSRAESIAIFMENLFLSMGLLLAVLGALEIAQVPIYANGCYMPFKTGSLVVPYIIIVSASPLVLEDPSNKKYLYITLMLASLILVEFAAGYYCSLASSIILWLVTVFLYRSRLRLRQLCLSLLVLLATYTVSAGVFTLIRPLLPVEVPLMEGLTAGLWRVHLLLAWPAIIVYSMFPYALLFIILLLRKQFFKTGCDAAFEKHVFTKRTSHMLLFVSIILAAYFSAYNYLPENNPGGMPVGVDVPDYAESLEEIVNSNNPVVQAFSEPLSSTRPFYMLFLYSIKRLTGLTPLQTAEAAPVILTPLLVFSYYVLAKRLFKNHSMGALAAIITLAGIQLPIGLFASYQANILGLTIGNLLATVALTVGSGASYPLASLLSFSGMLVHSWTTICYLTAIIATLAYNTVRKKEASSLAMACVIIVSALLSKPFVQSIQQPVKGSTDPMRAAQSTILNAVSIGNIERYWPDTQTLFTNWCHGFTASFFIYLLAILGVTRLHEAPENARILLTVFPLILTPLPLMNYQIASRIIFNTPLQLYASIAIHHLLQKSFGRRMLGASLGLLSLNYSILATANILRV